MLSRVRVLPHVRDACLNYMPRDVAGRHYDRYQYTDEKRTAWLVWELEVNRLAGETQTVTSLTRPNW